MSRDITLKRYANHDMILHRLTLSKDLETLVNNPYSFWEQFTVVVASGNNSTLLVKLSSVLFPLNIPLVIIESMCFYAYMHIVVNEHTIVETHPATMVDLRLNQPWPELIDFVNQYNLAELDDIDLAHVPYIVLLLKYLDSWSQSHDGQLPTKRELGAFKKTILAGKKGSDLVNFDEAVSSASHLFAKASVPSDITELFSDPHVTVTEKSSDFWVLVATLKEFVELTEPNSLPLTGVLPDMTADTTGFVRMQKVYRDKAKKDIGDFTNILHSKLGKLNRSTESISTDQIEAFCKNSKNIKVVRGSPLTTIYNSSEKLGKF